MADEKPTGQYKIPGQGSEAEFGKSSISGGTENVKSILTNKRVLTLIGIIVLAILVYYFGSEGSDEKVEPVAPKVETVSKAPAVQSAPPIVAPAPETVPVVSTQSDMSASQMSELSQISDRLDSYDKQLVSVSNNLSNLDSQIYNLSTKLDILSRDVNKLTPKPEVEKKPEKLVNFYIRAIVEGRAWIRSGLTNNLTVSVGDEIDTYGKVTGIYPNEGMITTSSGRSIVFMANE